ncbi:pyrroline-5-carboxylate reductase [Clostridium sp.]|jgi:pyrroline-5-carboxylate reductase|uniref:pyrroline-5-carboxylate reductase n=1 Tax=Clostridium sp. TaxID=1506 RepID=UPI0025C37134|nr:pyrroline-5-carboxylate reductase [Clostridium sp.]MCI9069853.1 pyrroline-5-carboxylate reductase [Clostridium sp.]MCI9304265.1 pyrroline-5-carboxylate reductase [Clostridium sp.]
MNRKIGIIGCGNMGRAMLSALLKSSDISNDDIIVSTKRENSAEKIRNDFKVKTTLVNSEVAEKSNILFLAVKPHFFKEVIEEIKDKINNDTIIISIAAGITISQIEEWFGKDIKLVRSMPNTPALVGEGMSAICPNKNITSDELNYVGKLYNSFGKYEILEEKDFHAFIALCGSSPAYVFMFIEAMADAGVKLGIPRAKAYKLVEQSVLGSAKLALETGKHPGVLKDEVCSPSGTTIDAVIDLERNGLRSTVISAVEKCAEKSKNM